MAFYADEAEVWKCPKHPSKRRHICGVCPTCLRDRLALLCPHCAHSLPCSCSSATSSSPASSSSDASTVSSLISREPAFRRSRSVAAIPFLRSRFASEKTPLENTKTKKSSSIWSVFKKSKREKSDDLYDPKMVMTRSRSVAVETTSAKGKGWYFPSPMKAFRQSKSSKVVQERSPLYRG